MTGSANRAVIAVLMLSACATQAAFADAYFDQGKKFFDKRQYTQALPYFQKSAQESPWDSSAAYYEALCFHSMRDYKHAAASYKNVVEHFPGSAAYVNAAAALKVLDPGYFKAGGSASGGQSGASAGGSGAGGDDTAALFAKVVVSAPNECKIPVLRQLDKNWISGNVNGRGINFNFSGDSTSITSKDATALGIKAKTGRHPVTVRVGQVTQTDFPIQIEDGDSAKLGADFFKKLAYRLDASNLIVTKSAGGSSYEVPFSARGQDIKISISINGRSGSAILDVNGGENIMPRGMARNFGMEVADSNSLDRYDPDTNPNGPVRGQAGYGDVKTQSSAEGNVTVKGPVNGTVRFKIDDKITDVKVTPTAFGGWKYQIDQGAKVIRFNR